MYFFNYLKVKLSNLGSLLMEKSKYVVSVGLYYGFLSTLAIGSSYTFLFKGEALALECAEMFDEKNQKEETNEEGFGVTAEVHFPFSDLLDLEKEIKKRQKKETNEEGFGVTAEVHFPFPENTPDPSKDDKNGNEDTDKEKNDDKEMSDEMSKEFIYKFDENSQDFFYTFVQNELKFFIYVGRYDELKRINDYLFSNDYLSIVTDKNGKKTIYINPCFINPSKDDKNGNEDTAKEKKAFIYTFDENSQDFFYTFVQKGLKYFIYVGTYEYVGRYDELKRINDYLFLVTDKNEKKTIYIK